MRGRFGMRKGGWAESDEVPNQPWQRKWPAAIGGEGSVPGADGARITEANEGQAGRVQKAGRRRGGNIRRHRRFEENYLC